MNKLRNKEKLENSICGRLISSDQLPFLKDAYNGHNLDLLIEMGTINNISSQNKSYDKLKKLLHMKTSKIFKSPPKLKVANKFENRDKFGLRRSINTNLDCENSKLWMKGFVKDVSCNNKTTNVIIYPDNPCNDSYDSFITSNAELVRQENVDLARESVITSKNSIRIPVPDTLSTCSSLILPEIKTEYDDLNHDFIGSPITDNGAVSPINSPNKSSKIKDKNTNREIIPLSVAKIALPNQKTININKNRKPPSYVVSQINKNKIFRIYQKRILISNTINNPEPPATAFTDNSISTDIESIYYRNANVLEDDISICKDSQLELSKVSHGNTSLSLHSNSHDDDTSSVDQPFPIYVNKEVNLWIKSLKTK